MFNQPFDPQAQLLKDILFANALQGLIAADVSGNLKPEDAAELALKFAEAALKVREQDLQKRLALAKKQAEGKLETLKGDLKSLMGQTTADETTREASNGKDNKTPTE